MEKKEREEGVLDLLQDKKRVKLVTSVEPFADLAARMATFPGDRTNSARTIYSS